MTEKRNSSTDERPVLLEICVASVQDVLIAEAAGADRVELNSALSLGGLTATPGTVRQALKLANIPIIAMARPRESGFCYSDIEFQSLLEDVRWLLEAGVQGVAFGVLNTDRQIDVDRCRQVVKLIGPDRDAVFHRAFDLLEDQPTGLQMLIDCGVDRVMTSGARTTAALGQDSIAKLCQKAIGSPIEILAAGQIRPDHVAELIRHTSVRQVHAGLGHWLTDASWGETGEGGGTIEGDFSGREAGHEVNFYAQPPSNPSRFRQTCHDSIRQMLLALAGGDRLEPDN